MQFYDLMVQIWGGSPATEPLAFGAQSASSSEESDTVLADDMATEENIEQGESQEKLNMYNLCQMFWNTCTISVAHLVVALPPPQNNVVVNMVKMHKECRYTWRLVSAIYIVNSTLFQGEGVSLVRHRQKYYNYQIPWIN